MSIEWNYQIGDVANTWQVAQVIDIDHGNCEDDRNQEKCIKQASIFVLNEIPVKVMKYLLGKRKKKFKNVFWRLVFVMQSNMLRHHAISW